mgnify:CR=1 FL=1
MKHKYEVVVASTVTVPCISAKLAKQRYDAYVTLSQLGFNEPVTLLKDGKIVEKHIPDNQIED